MRIRLTCSTLHYASIPYNTNHSIAAWIYKQLEKGSPEYSKFLHDRGYMGPDGKPRKLFTFSRLQITPKAIFKPSHIVIKKNSQIDLIISTPMFEEFVQSLVMGLFENQMMEIDGAHGQRIKFPIMVVTRVPEPAFGSEMHYRTLSPLVLKTVVDGEKGRQTYYYRPYDDGLANAVMHNLIGKYQTIHGTVPSDQKLDFQLDEKYIQKRGGPEKISNLITLREGHANATQIKGFSCPFVFKGSRELIETAWHAGVGDHTGMGFGCVEITKK